MSDERSIKLTIGMKKYDVAREVGKHYSAIKKLNPSLADSIKYTADMWKKSPDSVTMTVLRDLVKEINKTYSQDSTKAPEDVKMPVAESSLKPKKKVVLKKQKAPEEPVSTTPVIETLPPNGRNELPHAKSFPEKFKDQYSGLVLEAAHDIQTMKQLRQALERQESIVLAFYWTKRHLKQYEYFNGVFNPKEFENDMDLACIYYVSDRDKIAYAVSVTAEGMYSILPQHLEEDNGIRFCEGIEFQVYRKVEE